MLWLIKILLDTNLLIYRENHSVVNEKVSELTKILYDSNDYKIVVHPMTLEDLSHIKDPLERDIFYSKAKIYSTIVNPPKVPDDFNVLVGCSRLPNDLIDNNLLYSVYRNCVSYLITNDEKLKKKSKKIGIDDRVLKIEEAIKLFKPSKEVKIRTPIFINQEFLYNINLNDRFFDSLKKDYNGFEKWYAKKSCEGEMAYVTRYENGDIGSFLMLKVENENEDYSKFKNPFDRAIRLKVSTFKVANTGNKIGESYIKIIIKEAIKNNVDEIYVTIFEKQEPLIHLFSEYGFIKKTSKMTQKSDLSFEEELVFVKSMHDNTYPNFEWENKQVFIVPIRQEYHEMLFPESESVTQFTFGDMSGTNTYSNTIKKAYISNSNTNCIQPGDILVFYASGFKRSITTIGIVDSVFNNFSSPEELFRMAIKRTVYSLDAIKKLYKSTTKLILFKYYKSLNKPISYNQLIEEKIINSVPMSIVKIKNSNKLKKMLDEV